MPEKKEYNKSNTLIPLYDNEDAVCGIVYNGTPYYFLKNLQGDIIAIADANGDTVARYTYDAWGVPTITQDTTTVGIATVNPFRYRGYYYDSEIGMYYLQSRYYDPMVGRFVNADDAEIVKLRFSVLQVNLFAYCLNTPTNSIDVAGQCWAQLVARIILGAMLGFFIQLICDLIESWYITFILRKKDDRKFYPGDYLASMLSWALIFLAPASKLIRGILAALPYVIKICGRLIQGGYPWQSFLIDLVSAVISVIIAVCLGNNKVTTKRLAKIQARFVGHKNAAKKIAKASANFVVKLNKLGFRLTIAINISNALVQLLFNILTADK